MPLEFPAVTVCNTNPIKKSLHNQSIELRDLLASWEEQDTRKRRDLTGILERESNSKMQQTHTKREKREGK